MSRALILMAQKRYQGRDLTPQETRDVLAAWRIVAGGKRIRVPEPRPVQAELFSKAASLHENGWSIRRIAKTLKMSKSQVHRQVSQK